MDGHSSSAPMGCHVCGHAPDDPYVNERANERCVDPCHDAHYVTVQLEGMRRDLYGQEPVFTNADYDIMYDSVEAIGWDMRSNGAEVLS